MKTMTEIEMIQIQGSGDIFDDGLALAEQGAQMLVDGFGFGMSGPTVSNSGFAGIGQILLGELICAYDLIFSGDYTANPLPQTGY